MSTTFPTATMSSIGSQRMLAPTPSDPTPLPELARLRALLSTAAICGRGGAGFPTVRKLDSVAGTRPVVVGNAMEGEPLSHKDDFLLQRAPGLVLDGLEILGHALDADQTLLAVHERIDPGPALTLTTTRPHLEVHSLAGGFLTGQESALVQLLNGRPGLPTDPAHPVRVRGVGRRPTLVCNAETLAQIALLVRHGPDWFSTRGTTEEPGTTLVTLTGSNGSVVPRPGVVEIPLGLPLRRVLLSGDTDLAAVRAVLVGGFHGTWVGPDDLDVPFSRAGLAPLGAGPGAGVVHVLGQGTCPLACAAGITRWLAGEVAGQCGPCLNGLPALAASMTSLADPDTRPTERSAAEIARLQGLVTGRGACAHPDGSARFVASTMRVFAGHVTAHLEGRCPR